MNTPLKQLILSTLGLLLLGGFIVWYFPPNKGEGVSLVPSLENEERSAEVVSLPPTKPREEMFTDKTVERKIVEGLSTTTITFGKDRYSVEVVSLPPVKSREDALADRVVERAHFEENITEFGEIALRFLPDDYIEYVKKFDVNGDGVDEQIVGLCSGGNHCPSPILVVESDKIIFSTWGSVSTKEIIPSDDGNGFLVRWASDEQESEGFARPLGFMQTKFVYKDGTFISVEERSFSYTPH